MNQNEPCFSVAIVDRRDPSLTTLHRIRDLRRYFAGDDQGGKVKLLHPGSSERQQDCLERLDEWLDGRGALNNIWKHYADHYYVVVLDMNAE